MARAVLTSALPDHQARMNKQVVRGRQRSGAVAARHPFADKRFDQLTNPQKDQLLKAVALQLGLILPD